MFCTKASRNHIIAKHTKFYKILQIIITVWHYGQDTNWEAFWVGHDINLILSQSYLGTKTFFSNVPGIIKIYWCFKFLWAANALNRDYPVTLDLNGSFQLESIGRAWLACKAKGARDHYKTILDNFIHDLKTYKMRRSSDVLKIAF